LSKRFPFFNSADDVEAMIEIATIFGSKRMKQAGLLHGCMFETSIPTVSAHGFTLERIILWSTCRQPGPSQGGAEPPPGKPLDERELLAVRFLERCLELDPAKRISAEQALQHEFLKFADDLDDEMDLVGESE
jgi:cell division control protein 7